MEAAAESLIASLAKEQVGKDIPLTEAQETLGASKKLVYMCGLVVTGEKPPPFTSQQTNRFTYLQNLYNKSLGDETKTKQFRLTPTLVPSKEAQAVIDKDVIQRKRDLELQSNKVLQELLSEENEQPAPSIVHMSSAKRKQKSKNISHSAQTKVQSDKAQSDEDPAINDKETSLSSITVQQILAASTVRHEAEEMQGTDADASWTEVRPKRTQKKNHGEETDPKEGSSSLPASSFKPSNFGVHGVEIDKRNEAKEGYQNNSLRGDADADAEERSVSLPAASLEPSSLEAQETEVELGSKAKEEEEIAVESIVISGEEDECVRSPADKAKAESNAAASPAAALTITSHAPISSHVASEREVDGNLLNLLKDKLQQLEQQLTEKDQKLEEMRVAHKKEMQAEKERMDERVQALQLRLYISETRLKTFEDALAQHVEAVASNVSTAPSTPERGGTHGGPASSRLFSRAARP